MGSLSLLKIMPEEIPPPGFTPTNYQRITGGSHLRWQPPAPEHLQEMLPAHDIKDAKVSAPVAVLAKLQKTLPGYNETN